MSQREINGWKIQPSVHPSIVALWDLFDRMPEVFGGSIDNFESARSYLDELHAGGKLESGTLDEVLSRLDAMKSNTRESDVMREDEAAAYLRVCVRTLKRWCAVDDLPHRVVADKRLYSRKAIDLWAAGREVGELA